MKADGGGRGGRAGGAGDGIVGDDVHGDGADGAREGSRPPLAEDYYVSAFMTVLDTVEARHPGLPSAAELAWAAALRACPTASRRLYVRLATRRGARFRLSKLAYAEIDRLLDVPAGAGRRRADKVEALLARDASADRAALVAADAWVRPLGLERFRIFRLCFFGNLHQDLSEFVLSDLGAVRYEPYALDGAVRRFATREQAERHLRHHDCELAFERLDRTDPDALRALLTCLPTRLEGDPTLERRLDRLGNAVARDLERLGLVDEALFVYGRGTRPRRARRPSSSSPSARSRGWPAPRRRGAPTDDAPAPRARGAR